MAHSSQTGEEEDNFIRMFKLVTGIGTDAVRHKFDQFFPVATLASDLKTHEPKLKQLNIERRLTMKQMTLLFPATGSASSKDFDVTIMICLIRNLTSISPPIYGFDKQPPTSETTEGADLARIKFFRNKLAHAENNKINTNDFNTEWTDLTNAIVRLGGQQYQTVCNELKSIKLVRESALKDIENQLSILRESFSEELRDLKEIEIKGIKKKLQELFDEQSEVIPLHIREQFQAILEEWITADKKYVPTAATKYVIEKLKTVNSITVTGNAGMGKTYLTRHVALEMVKEGYTIVPVSKPEDIRNYFKMGLKVVYVVDNVCGRFTLNQNYLDSWNQMKEHIKRLLKDSCCKIISTCRLQVFQDTKFEELKEIFTMSECNVTSAELRLTEDDKIKMAKMYFPEDWNKIIDLAKLFDFFPLLCRLYNKETHGDICQFFKNPKEVLQEEVNKLLLTDKEGKLKYCCLVLCTLYNNTLTEKMLTDVNTETRQIIEDVFDKCRLNRSTSIERLIDSFKVLNGTYVKIANINYKIIHDKLFDIFAQNFGGKMLSVFIKHADSGFIRERFIWRTLDLTDRDLSFTINIPDEEINKYLDRLIKDWTQDKIRYVFDNINIHNSKQFRQTFMSHVKNLSPSDQQELANKTDKYGGFKDTPLTASCFIGDVSIIQWLLDLNVDVNQCRSDGASPLDIACQEGFIDIVQILIANNGNINACADDGCSPLYQACGNGHTDIVELLIEHTADVNQCTDTGDTPLYVACLQGHTDIVELLTKHGANINVSSFHGITPLCIACVVGHLEVVNVLLRERADVNIRDEDNYSPLDCALEQNHVAIVDILLEYITSEDNCPPLDSKGEEVVAAILNTYCSPLHTEGEQESVDTLKTPEDNEIIYERK